MFPVAAGATGAATASDATAALATAFASAFAAATALGVVIGILACYRWRIVNHVFPVAATSALGLRFGL